MQSLILNICRQCPYVLEAIIGLAELGATAKDIISAFTQVLSLSTIFLLPVAFILTITFYLFLQLPFHTTL